MKPADLLSSFPFDESKFILLSSDEQRVFEDEHIVVLFDFVEVVHIELGDRKCTCLTKEEKLECRKYFGKISLVKETTSVTAKPMSSLSQQIIFLF